MLPSLYDAPKDFAKLFKLRAQLETLGPAVVIDFTRCSFIRHNAVAFLGALIRHCESLGKRVRIDWPTVRVAVCVNLRQNGFAHTFGDPIHPWDGNSIPYREDVVGPASPLHEKRDQVMNYLRARWLGRHWVNVSTALGNAIRGRVWEIYANSFEHAASPVGVFTCGQHYPKQRQLSLCVVDFGEGIPHKVRRYLGRPRMRASDAVHWAFQRGHSTDPGIGRGLGFDILSEFVRFNHGRMDVYSGGAHARIARDVNQFEDVEDEFRGTIVDIRLTCDESVYVLASELPSGPLFE